jgi:pyruvate-formate lyase-activating enzyme
VRRYGAQQLAEELGAGFELVTSMPETHQTPWNSTQEFVYCIFRRKPDMPLPTPDITPIDASAPAMAWKLWIYTNYDCNLRCTYCVAKSSPNAARRAIGASNAKQLVDEAVALGFDHVFFTGGEPFLLPDIYEMLAYSAERVKTSVLTNAMIIRGARLEKLRAIKHPNLILQVSLDGGEAAHHDAYRGAGTWAKTVEGIKLLQAEGFDVRLSTTETPANSAHMDAMHAFRATLDIPEDHHFIRPLAKRGYSKEGIALDMTNLVPEVTVNLDGVFWHPLSTDADMQVSKKLFPLKNSVERIQTQLDEIARTGKTQLRTFT